MAFKVESLQEMNTIAETMSSYATEAEAQTKKVVTAVEQLDALISGQGVDEALTKLKDSITENADSATKVLKYVSLFIKSNAQSLSANEDETANVLNNVQNTLNNITL